MTKGPQKSGGTARTAAGTTPGKINLKLLSEHLGLSRTTVSLVLNDAPLAKRLSAETRERVLRAAEELSYKPNYFARSLSGKRSKMIGVLAPDFGDGYDSVLLSGIERELLDNDYIYFVSSHLWSPDVLTRSLDTLVERGAEGLLLLNTPLPKNVRLPSVAIGSGNPQEALSVISIDNYYGMRLAVEQLVKLGHRRIAVLKGHVGSSDTEERWSGAQAAMKEFDLDLPASRTMQLERLSAEGMFGIDEGYVATEKLLKNGSDFTGLVCFNDSSACGAMNAIRDAGLRVPQDISVIGFDDVTLAKIVYPTLTTVRQPLREMGRQAAIKLIEMIEKPDEMPTHTFIKPDLILRNSTTTPTSV